MINISEEERSIILQIIKKHISNYEVRVFGSRLYQNLKPASDLDIVIMDSKNRLDDVTYFNLIDEFQNSDLRFRVDVIKWSDTDESFRKIINQNYEILYMLDR
ncbi:MAG: nucleotidyltransferase family protein [Myxococcota bacterium]